MSDALPLPQDKYDTSPVVRWGENTLIPARLGKLGTCIAILTPQKAELGFVFSFSDTANSDTNSMTTKEHGLVRTTKNA